MDERLRIICGDLVDQKVEGIINPSDTSLFVDSELSLKIHKKAGPNLKLECKAMSPASTGDAKITSAYDLYFQHIVHSICPNYIDGNNGEVQLLRSCYLSSFALILKLRMRSIAIPILGIDSGFPEDLAIDIAISETQKFLKKTDLLDRVLFVCKEPQLHELLLKKYNSHLFLSNQKKIFNNDSELQSCISQFSILTNVNRIDFSDIDLSQLSKIFHSGPLKSYIPDNLNNILKHKAKINANGDYCYQIDGQEHIVPAPYLPLVHFIFDHFSQSSDMVHLPKQKAFHLLWNYVDDIVSWATNLDTSLYNQSFNIIKELEKSRLEIFEGIRSLNQDYSDHPLYEEILILPDLIYTLSRLLISRGVHIDLKVDILLALIYVISPVDFIPEGFVQHPIAYMDDLAICYLVLNKAINQYQLHPRILEREWKNSSDKLKQIPDDYQRVLQIIDPRLIDLIWNYLQKKLKE